MPTYAMRPMNDQETYKGMAAVRGKAPVVGEDTDELCCGNCARTVVAADAGDIRNIAIRCSCGTYIDPNQLTRLVFDDLARLATAATRRLVAAS